MNISKNPMIQEYILQLELSLNHFHPILLNQNIYPKTFLMRDLEAIDLWCGLCLLNLLLRRNLNPLIIPNKNSIHSLHTSIPSNQNGELCGSLGCGEEVPVKGS